MTSPNGPVKNDTKIMKRAQEVAEKHDWKMSHVALAWINRRVGLVPSVDQRLDIS